VTPKRAKESAVNVKRPFVTAFCAMGALSLVACYPLTFDDAADLDMVVTRKAEHYDYSKNRTYDLPKTVIDICGVEDIPIGEGGAGGQGSADLDEIIDCEESAHLFDDEILEAVERNLEALGYVKATGASGDPPPDVIVSVGTIQANNYVAYVSYPWWGYYPSYYYYYYYWWSYYYGWWGYYPYYPTTTVVNYPTGTVLMQMLSTSDADEVNERVPVVWTGAVRGLLESSDEVTASARINGGIDQAFAQSPYLKVSP
jgi:hypothetical protein